MCTFTHSLKQKPDFSLKTNSTSGKHFASQNQCHEPFDSNSLFDSPAEVLLEQLDVTPEGGQVQQHAAGHHRRQDPYPHIAYGLGVL